MLKLLASLIPFIKELFFDRKEEMDFTSPSFNTKKWVQYILFLILIFLVMATSSRLIAITSKHVKLNEEFNKDELIVKQQKEQIDNLKDEFNLLKKEKDVLNSHCYPYPAKKMVEKVKKS